MEEKPSSFNRADAKGILQNDVDQIHARPLAIPANFYYFHFPTMLIILYSFRAFIFMNKDGSFKRWQGAWLLGVYLIYVILQYALNVGSVEG